MHKRGIHVMVKPVGSSCNLRCDYCFYLEKAGLGCSASSGVVMDDGLLDQFIRQYLSVNMLPEVQFV